MFDPHHYDELTLPLDECRGVAVRNMKRSGQRAEIKDLDLLSRRCKSGDCLITWLQGCWVFIGWDIANFGFGELGIYCAAWMPRIRSNVGWHFSHQKMTLKKRKRNFWQLKLTSVFLHITSIKCLVSAFGLRKNMSPWCWLSS